MEREKTCTMKEPLKDILIVEDSKMFAHAISARIEADLGCRFHLAGTFRQARQLMRQKGGDLFAAVLDLVLPDAPQGEVVDFALKNNIPSIIMTSEFSETIRQKFISRDIVDYIVKEGAHSLDQLIHTLRRLNANRFVKVLIVDDARHARHTIRQLLMRHRFITLEAQDGRQALEMLDHHPDIRVVVTDCHMPQMDGFELITRIRKTHPMDQLAIIGVSSSSGSTMSARFLKKGANDVIVKPYFNEEFYLRINQNVQMLEHIDAIRNAAIKDHLTGLYNRRYFFEVGEKLFKNAQRKNFDIVLAMIDIDHFKRVNDRFGHAAGDEVLCHVSAIMAGHFRSSDVIARLGGEEFCVLAPGMSPDHCFELFDSLRQSIASNPLTVDGNCVNPTVSIGLTATMGRTLDATLNHADQCLYRAKDQGRNQVVFEKDSTGQGSSD